MDSQRIISEFHNLQEKCQMLFAGLGDVPPFGRKHWQTYFQRTFDVYNRLWKFQQDHRAVLEADGLQRHEIGEIASKIGQLYYQYYLRTGDTDYLFEAMVFYRALRSRGYFRDVPTLRNPALQLKQLRYYARYVVVLLLLCKFEVIREIYPELQIIVSHYIDTFQPADASDWELVLCEISTFLQSCQPLAITSGSLRLSYRMPLSQQSVPIYQLSPLAQLSTRSPKLYSTPPPNVNTPGQPLAPVPLHPAPQPQPQPSTSETVHQQQQQQAQSVASTVSQVVGVFDSVGSTGSSPAQIELLSMGVPVAIPSSFLARASPKLKLRDAILVANASNQVKFSELSVDAYRMVHSLEFEIATTEQPPSEDRVLFLQDNTSNPHKCVLHRPSLEQLMICLATSMKESGDSGATMLYISADGYRSQSSQTSGISPLYEAGGIWLRRKSPVASSQSILYPNDIMPFTRRPLFLVVDSDNADAFSAVNGTGFDQPVIVMMSPQQAIADSRSGGVLTLFLHSPIAAFCFLAGLLAPPPAAVLQKAVQQTASVLSAIVGVLQAETGLDRAYPAFMSDTFFAQFILRFIFGYFVISLHKRAQSSLEKTLPQISPALPVNVLRNATVREGVLKLAALLNVSDTFVSKSGPSSLTEQ